jgi:short subunit dehydrogenase-like uncharacterized protein
MRTMLIYGATGKAGRLVTERGDAARSVSTVFMVRSRP